MPMYVQPDGNTTTREKFTDFYINWPLPSNANEEYRKLFLAHQRLLKLLCDHPAMDPNRQQTYNTPANSKNKVYFMWDFVGRTFALLSNTQVINPANPSGKEWVDIMLRGTMAHSLIVDTTGRLEQQNRAVGYHDDEGVEFSDEIKRLAPTLSGIEVP
ncbi:hypothetical protein DM02DRAFT_618988 [Periconia macrospinosa]|uniref:Uncharacterized protein n=1 Tax=Periconia macrospinosa TaxID=97972 RepID=A0A2V1D8K8_9PLEO|nr:hypothetical protein DM02DRAFT_618988 [Periconia macrospinosa]